MAYAALISLVETLKHFLHHDESPLDPPTKQQLRPLYQTITSLQSHLEKIYPVTRSIRGRVNALETETRLATYEAQDKIESLIFRRANPEPGPHQQLDEPPRFSDELRAISIKIEEINRTAKEIADSIEQPEEDDSRKLLLRSDSAIILKHRIVGQEEDFRILTEKLMAETSQREVLPIHGMAGIGKTTLARSIYDDSHIERHFPVRAWVTVTTEYSIVEIYSRLLRSIESLSQKSEDAASRFGEKTRQETESELSHKVYQSLYGNRYLIIVDDMWDIKVWNRVQRSFPSGGRVILTTRDEKIAKEASSSEFTHQMKLLSVENSWILLCDRAFKGGNCPPRLEDSGRKIAENCKGLPLSLVVVGGQLSQESKTVEYWRKVEEDINAEAAKSEQPYREILSLSYSNLPSNLKACFLYMAAFPEDSEIPLSKLIKLWVGEGFLTNSDRVRGSEDKPKTLEDIAEENLKDLINRNLFAVRSLSSNGHDIKTCGIHDVLRDLSVTESQCQLFFHTINRYIKELKEGAEDQRRLSIHKNILMCMEDVYNVARLMKDVRAIIYAGRHHHHPMPFCLAFDLLRIMDALTMYFIEFPDELIRLVHLRFLSLTYNGQIPSSISKLTNLHVLMVRQHPKIIYVGVSVLPPEIWKMSQLRHIVFTESELPELPKASSILFENLQTLTNVNIASCTEEVLDHMPNLKKLGMWTISPGEFGFYLDKLQKLEDFKFTVLCPIPGKKIGFMPKLFFPKTIRKLYLSGCGISWDEMSVVGRLPKLEVLKLREFACQGEVWEPNDGEFSEVKFLLLEALDLQCWYAEDTNFPSLRCLIINHCYNLEEVPEGIGGVAGLRLIEMVDCGPTAVESLEKIKKNQLDLNKHLRVRIYTSWK